MKHQRTSHYFSQDKESKNWFENFHERKDNRIKEDYFFSFSKGFHDLGLTFMENRVMDVKFTTMVETACGDIFWMEIVHFLESV